MNRIKNPLSPLIFLLFLMLFSNCSEDPVDVYEFTSEDQAAEEIYNSREKYILRNRYGDAA